MILRTLLRAAGMLLAVAAAYLLLQRLDVLGEVAIVPGLIGLVVLVWLVLPSDVVPDRNPIFYTIAGTALAAGIGIFFRTHYLWTVPIGYNFEPLGFVFFAYKLIAEHFPYIPYSWYAHTLYGYIIALAALVCPSELIAFRVASAAISLSTLVVLYVFLRRLFGDRPAWVGTALLGASYWHMFASRNGYHQQLLPLFQLLFLYGLLTGIETRRFRGFAIAAVAMVLGLHSHWGFYLMPLVWVLIIAYLFCFDRPRFRATLPLMVRAIGLTALLALPLFIFLVRNSDVFGYVFRGFSLGMSEASDFSSKMSKNWRLVVWWLSGHPAARAEYGSAVDFIVGTAALVGLAVSIRRFLVSLPHAALVLLLAINVLGLSLTLAYFFYVIATMAAVYGLAGIGISAVATQLEALNRRVLSPVVFVAIVALIGWQARINYDVFFRNRIFSDLGVPWRPPGQFFPLLDDVKQLVDTRVVYVPRDEPGRDFDAQIFELGQRVAGYAFVLKTLPFDAATVLFPAARLGAAEGVEIIQPNNAFVQDVMLPVYRRLYPHMTVREVLPPEPYFSRDPTPMAIRISLPRADVAAYHGLRPGAAATVQEGLVFVPSDARVYFRAALEPPPKLWVHDVPVAFEAAEQGPPRGTSLLLEGGLHAIRVEGAPSTGAGIEWRRADGTWETIDPWLLNRGDVEASVLEPYLAALGTRASFYYSQVLRVETPVTPQDAAVNADGNIVGVDARTLTEYDHTGRAIRHQALPGPTDFRLGQLDGKRVLVEPDGAIFSLQGDAVSKIAAAGCELLDTTSAGARLLGLCRGGQVVDENGASVFPQPLHPLNGGDLQRPAHVANTAEGLYVVDALAAQLLLYGPTGELRRGRVMSHLYWESEIEVDPKGNLYVKRRSQGIKAYAPDGRLLFHPETDLPVLFTRGAHDEVDTISPRRLKFTDSTAVAVLNEGIIVFDKVAD